MSRVSACQAEGFQNGQVVNLPVRVDLGGKCQNRWPAPLEQVIFRCVIDPRRSTRARVGTQHLVVIVAAPSGEYGVHLSGGRAITGQPSRLRPWPTPRDRGDVIAGEGLAEAGPAVQRRDAPSENSSGGYLAASQDASDRMSGLVRTEVKCREFVGSHLAREVRSGD